MPSPLSAGRTGWFRAVLRAGFGVVIALSVLSAVEAFRVRAGLPAQALEIYRRHVQQDDILFRLRRTLWLGAIAGRDFLLDPHPERTATFRARLATLRADSTRLLDALDSASASRGACQELRSKVNLFWESLEPLPASARGLRPEERYDLVQHELVARRDAVADNLWEFTRISQKALEDSELQFARLRRSADSRLFFTLGLSVVLGLLVAGFSLVHSERQYQAVAKGKADFQRLSARLLEIQEEERTRLSRELHDQIGQALATLRLEIARVESVPGRRLPEMRARLAEARALAENTIRMVRDTALWLRPALLDDLGLRPALEWLIEDFHRRTGMACELSAPGPGGVLPGPVRTCVYRAVQEALHNCEKHSAAMSVRVSLAQAPGSVVVTVEDDGGGFDPETARGFGLLGMRERAAALAGSLAVESAPGKGTRLTLRLPVDAAQAAAGARP